MDRDHLRYFLINLLISSSVAKVKVFIKKFISYEGCMFRSSLSSGNFKRIIVILSTKKFENLSQIVLSDKFSDKEGAGNL